MLPVDLLAVLLRALKRDQVRRLILVGDPNQLPPIGPGRPLADILAWLDHEERRHAFGHLRERARAKDVQSEALQLSDLFTSEPPNASDDDILVRAATGALQRDLEVHFWTTADELQQVLFERLGLHLGVQPSEKEYEAFNRSLKDGSGNAAPDRWQILSPVRGQGFGTEQLNRLIQYRFHGGLLRRRGARPIGGQQIVFLDKVMQVQNRRRRDTAGNEGYVANGDVGLVIDHWRRGGRSRSYLLARNQSSGTPASAMSRRTLSWRTPPPCTRLRAATSTWSFSFSRVLVGRSLVSCFTRPSHGSSRDLCSFSKVMMSVCLNASLGLSSPIRPAGTLSSSSSRLDRRSKACPTRSD